MTAEKWVPSTEDLRGILREYYLGHDHFDAWLADRDRAVKAEALREAALRMMQDRITELEKELEADA